MEALRVTPWVVRVAGAAAAVVVAVVGTWAVTRGGGSEVAPPQQPLQIRSFLEPRTHLFGDPVTAEVEVVVNRRAVDPGSIRVRANFAPYTVLGVSGSERRAGDAVTIGRRWTLLCIVRDCASSTARLPEPQQIAEARVQFRLRGGPTQSRPVVWPDTEVATRLNTVELSRAAVLTPWRADLTPPKPSYRSAPGLASGALFALALLVAAGGVLLLWPELRRLLRVPKRRKDPLAGLPPLERALALLQFALASGGPEEQRKALDRLGRELRLRGNDDLAGAARRLAWSPSRPSEDELGAFAGRVAQAVGAPA